MKSRTISVFRVNGYGFAFLARYAALQPHFDGPDRYSLVPPMHCSAQGSRAQLNHQPVTQFTARVLPSLDEHGERFPIELRMGLQIAIEATKVTSARLIAIAERLHACDVLSHERAKRAAPLWQRAQPLEGVAIVLPEERTNDRHQTTAIVLLQLREGMQSGGRGRFPVEVAHDDPGAAHDVVERRSRGIAFKP